MEKVLHFLTRLAANNNREWFEENKPEYVECRNKILFTTDVLINELRKFDTSIPLLDAKDCMFRIFRDVRFSHDKRPYKTNFGSFIAKGGRKSDCPGYYFHIEPGQSFAGGGLYRPSPENLKSLRTYIDKNGARFAELLDDKKFKKALPDVYTDKVKTAPKGFSKEHPYIELLRCRSFAFSVHVPDAALLDGTFIEKAVDAFKQVHKVNALLSEALQDAC